MLRISFVALLITAVVAFTVESSAHGSLLETYVTGESGGAHVVFHVLLDPTDPTKTAITVAATDTIRLDGIDFLPGSTTKVVVGAQTMMGGAIPQYDVGGGLLLPSLVASTGAGTQPSTVLSTPDHAYYVENQFGFSGSGTHRIMRTPIAGPPGTTEIVYDATGTLSNLEGLEIVGGRLYFFAEDDVAADKRALYSVALDAGGIATGAPAKHLGGLTEGAMGDGSDELDFDPGSGLLFGSNIISGEIVFWDVGMGSGGFLISPAEIAAAGMGSDVKFLETALLDGVRTTGDGYLVLTGLSGAIVSVDIAGAMAGVGDEDIFILYDDAVAMNGYSFDDLTPLNAVPEPTSLLAWSALAAFFVGRRFRRRRAT